MTDVHVGIKCFPNTRNNEPVYLEFDLQSQLLARLLDLVQQGEVYTQLYQPGAFTSNAGYVEECIRQILREIYPTLPQ